VDLRLSNEARVVALVVGTSYFILPNGLVLELYNCYFFQYFKTLFPFYLVLKGFRFIF
jgi:hypothetical protein